MGQLQPGGVHIAAPAIRPRPRVEGDPTRTPIPELAGYHPGRPPWSAPKGRDLLAGVSVLAVLAAILVVMARDVEPRRLPPGSAQAFPRANLAATAAGAVPAWTDVPVATSVVELGPALSQPVASGLSAARARIERCVAVERRRARDADPSPDLRRSAERGPGRDGGDRAAAAELILHLSPRSGAVHVDGVEPRAVGASALLADCARRHLDGDAFPASGAVAGRRYRLLVVLR